VADSSFVFVSYARADREPVSQIVDELRKLGIETWVDADQLGAGEVWERAISRALAKSQAVLVFISPAMVKSSFVNLEFEEAVKTGARILPVLLTPTEPGQIPNRLRAIQWLDASHTPLIPKQVAQEIANVLSRWSTEESPQPFSDANREGLAKALAEQSRQTGVTPEEKDSPTSVFLVHGHDEELLQEVIQFLEGVGLKSIVLSMVGGASRSLIDKFFDIGGAARFAIVLLSADDMGASRLQFEETDVGAKALKYRSRQNTILELGYFYGLLGWDKVFVLEKRPPKNFPDFERPSDLNGVVFDRYDTAGKWKKMVAQRLRNHGFVLINSS
jgi:predicted nucleotide-binding protein